MSEIEKLMQNAGIKKAPDINNCYPEMMKCHHCEHYKVIDEYTGRCLNEVYPEFTAEKQIELIKWLAKIGEYCELSICWNDISKSFQFNIRNMCNGAINRSVCGIETSFEEVLAYLLNSIWLILTDTEKEEIKRILE